MRSKSAIPIEPLGPPAFVSSGGPWWDELPLDFWKREEYFAPSAALRASIIGTALLDQLVRAPASTALTAVFVPIARKRVLERQLHNYDFYTQSAFLENPARFFEQPTQTPTVTTKRGRSAIRTPRGALVEELQFESGFVPVNPEARAQYLSHKENSITHARFLRHGDRPRPTVLVLHGFWASPYWINEAMFELPMLYRLGFDVLLPTLPFHGLRRMERALFSGQGFITPELSQTNEAFAHAIWDLRRLLLHLRSLDVPDVGITGLSLGGYVTALLASVEPSLAFAIPNVPVVSLVDLLLGWHPLGELVRIAMYRSGMDLRASRKLLAVHTPLTHRPALPRDRLLLVAGAGDRLAPPAQARLLWEHWNRPQSYWFPGNHLLHFDRGRYLQGIATFLRNLSLTDES